MNNLEDIIKSSQLIVHPGRYAYLKCQNQEKEIGNHFLISQDQDEVTIITEEANISDVKFDKEVKWFKLFEFQISAPFVSVGFLAKISQTVAEKGLNILIVSTFSKDYALIKEENFQIALDALKKVGFTVINN